MAQFTTISEWSELIVGRAVDYKSAAQIEYADVAQLAEQLICNQQVIGSSPIIGFTTKYSCYGWIPEWPKGTDCKSAANCFGGSNPPLPIGITFSVIAYNKIYYRGMEQSGSSPGS